MKQALLLALFAFYSSAAIGGDSPNDGCSANFDEFKSILKADDKGFKSVEPVHRNRGKHAVTQEAVLASGERMRFMVNGCTHYGYSFSYYKMKKKAANRKAAIALALKLLEKTPAEEGKKDVLVKALKAAQSAKGEKQAPYILPCGDAHCEIDFYYEDSQTDALRIGYSLAL